MSGQLPASKGAVYFFSSLLNTYTLQELAQKIAIIGQSERPDPRLSVREYISLGTIPHERQVITKDREGQVQEAIGLLSCFFIIASRCNGDNCGKPLTFDKVPKRMVVHDINMTEVAFSRASACSWLIRCPFFLLLFPSFQALESTMLLLLHIKVGRCDP